MVWFNFIFLEKQTSSSLWFIVADCNLHAESRHQTPDRREILGSWHTKPCPLQLTALLVEINMNKAISDLKPALLCHVF